MSSFQRKYKRSLDKLINELKVKILEYDGLCDVCSHRTKDCNRTCKELYRRNYDKNKELIDQIKSRTGDSHL